jgi:hypothetical protein
LNNLKRNNMDKEFTPYEQALALKEINQQKLDYVKN